MSFNLIDEPWVPVLYARGRSSDVSLSTLFQDATEIRRISAELPTVSFAILRLALAICHHALGVHTRADVARQLRDGIEVDKVLGYLEQYKDRFDLFHPDRPFYQVGSLHTAKGEVSGLEKLIADVPNGSPYMTMRSGEGLRTITAAEAAQWLVHAQAFDPSGIRSGAVGDPLVKGGKGYPIGPAWAGRIGGVVLHGAHLAQTLTFNMVPVPENPLDIPVWAAPEPQTERRELEAEPAGPLSVLTWQARRVRLEGDRDGVTGVVLAQGDQLKEQNRMPVEPMTAWRYSKPQTAKFKLKVYMPQKHNPARAMWRGVPALLKTSSSEIDGSPASLPPATVTSLREQSGWAGDYDLRAIIETVGMEYGPQEATVEEVVNDTLGIQLSLLSEEAAQIREMLDSCIATADACVYALGRMGANVAAAAGDFDGVEGAKDRAMLLAWAELDAPARAWISRLSSASSVPDERLAWQKLLATTLLRLASTLSEGASTAAVVGRRAGHGFMTAALAEVYFRAALRKELPLAFPQSTEKKESPDE
ncbi:type I-E CRISPR-associated protein Cse1/CasA [uncultured Tessaracoccus sp.]|uniref:type I-E CRISPR-associated protein Cse1/CasA n=1 Tax=uncultured Tessaracoccus sp. TaxID=905023 RepID=UPI002600BC85|nr:type I-E CRISPR-associated protein Cse1/CasA [uncultured Tessaracoccus sp.]